MRIGSYHVTRIADKAIRSALTAGSGRGSLIVRKLEDVFEALAKSKVLYAVTLALCALLSLLSGCGTEQTFPGDERPASETARIQGFDIPGIKSVNLLAVDGKKLGFMSRDAVVLPGEHVIMAGVVQNYLFVVASGGGVLTCDLQAGRTYSLNGTTSKGKVVLWLEDPETTTAVCGHKPQ